MDDIDRDKWLFGQLPIATGGLAVLAGGREGSDELVDFSRVPGLEINTTLAASPPAH